MGQNDTYGTYFYGLFDFEKPQKTINIYQTTIYKNFEIFM